MAVEEAFKGGEEEGEKEESQQQQQQRLDCLHSFDFDESSVTSGILEVALLPASLVSVAAGCTKVLEEEDVEVELRRERGQVKEGHGQEEKEKKEATPLLSIRVDLGRDEEGNKEEAVVVDATVAHSPGGRWLVSDSLPDDALASVLSFTDNRTPALLLLAVSRRWGRRLKQREGLWRGLCCVQPKWKAHLPTRPRKSWAEVFVVQLGREERERKVLSDEVLRKAHVLLRRGDNVVSLRKLVGEASAKFGFCVDHQSGVVLERNPLLNLAVMLKRPKVVAWLVVEANAAVNLADLGGFTPLMDAAWAGDRELVRLLLHFGADPKRRGHSHFSGGIKLSGPWHDAAGWARAKGHDEVAAHLTQWAGTDPRVIASVQGRAMAVAKEAAAKAAAAQAQATQPTSSTAAAAAPTN